MRLVEMFSKRLSYTGMQYVGRVPEKVLDVEESISKQIFPNFDIYFFLTFL